MKLWKGPSGLNRLIELSGDVEVPLMVAKNGYFIGDMNNLQLLTAPLKSYLHETLETPESTTLYLAQCPILLASSTSSKELQPGPLHALWQDIVTMPRCLASFPLTHVNLWASKQACTSSLHYDPHNNMLCCVEGQKQIRIVPPSFAPEIKAQKAFHDSANHAGADLWDILSWTSKGQKVVDLGEYPQEFILNPGDALFIPAGWWHQVKSKQGTLAVNFWWTGEFDQLLGSGGASDEMSVYYLRRTAQALTEKRREELLRNMLRRNIHQKDWCSVLQEFSIHILKRDASKRQRTMSSIPGDDSYFVRLREGSGFISKDMNHFQFAAYYYLVLLLSEDARKADPAAWEYLVVLPNPDVDPINSILFTLVSDRETGSIDFRLLMTVLLTMRWQHTSTAEQLLYKINGASWELLTSQLEKWARTFFGSNYDDQGEAAIEEFYDQLYGCCSESSHRWMFTTRMLEQKQLFAKKAMVDVVNDALGFDFKV